MAGNIPQQFIDDLLTRVDVVDVINQRVPLKKAGAEYKACCPFHDEKTPSFTVSPGKQFYHCFGCGAHGSAIRFLMDYDRLSFPEAIEELAGSLGLEVPREGGFAPQADQRPVYQVLEQAAGYFGEQLRHHPKAKQAIAYLQKRGLSGEIAQKYRIGFAPPGWDNLLKHFGEDNKTLELLRKAGLISEPEGKRYDRFRDRIMFPIRDSRGRVIGFGGRVMGDGTPKYLNSPETPVFHKGSELYGLHEAKQAHKAIERLLVVEGYMDVIALAQYGITHAVATLGTAATAQHLEKMFRTAPEIVFCFDGDRAGRDAAWKALNTILPLLLEGRQARFLFLPEGEDPDTLVRRIGQEAFLQQVAGSEPLSEFLFRKLSSQVDMTSLDGRARLVTLAKPYLNQLPTGVFRDMMEAHLAKITGAKADAPKKAAPRAAASRQKKQQPGTMPLMHRAIALLLQTPELAQLDDLPNAWIELDNNGSHILHHLLESLRKTPHLTTAALIEHWQDERIRRHLSRLAVMNLELSGDEEAQFRGALYNLGMEARESSSRGLRDKFRPSDMTSEEKQKLRELYSVPKDKSQ